MRNSRRRFLINQAVIFVGGEGSRLKNLNLKIPKPLIKINNKPILKIIINNLERYHFNEFFIMCVEKNLKYYKKFFQKYKFDSKIHLISEKVPTGTLGAVKKIIEKCNNFFLICNGDTLHNFDLAEFKRKINLDKHCSLLVTHKENLNKKFNQNLLFQKSEFVSSGVCILNKKKINKILNKTRLKNFEDLILYNDLKRNSIDIQKQNNKYFYDIGTLDRYKRKEFFFNKLIKKKTVILDRDGIINYDYGYVNKIKDFKFTKFIFKLISFLNKNNFYVFVITNQSGIGRGYYSEKTLKKLHEHMNFELFKKNCNIDKIFYSPYFKSSKEEKYRFGSQFRKPNIGFFKVLKKEWNVDEKNTLFIGDTNTDKIFAENSKISFLLENHMSNFEDIKKKLKQNFNLNE